MLIVDDPDVPGGNFTHWLMRNVVPDLTEIAANRPPSHAVQGVNDFGKSKYSGPSPPPGIHRYYFRLYALDTALALPPTSKRKTVDSGIKGHILGEATLVGRYARKGNKRGAELHSVMHTGQVISNTRYATKSCLVLFLLLLTSLAQAELPNWHGTLQSRVRRPRAPFGE